MIENLIRILTVQYPYVLAMVMLVLCIYAVVAKRNLIKKIIGLGLILDTVNLFVILVGYRRVAGAIPPIYPSPEQVLQVVQYGVDPLPQCLVLTAIVIDTCVTAFALALIVMIYRTYGSIESEKVRGLKG